MHLIYLAHVFCKLAVVSEETKALLLDAPRSKKLVLNSLKKSGSLDEVAIELSVRVNLRLK